MMFANRICSLTSCSIWVSENFDVQFLSEPPPLPFSKLRRFLLITTAIEVTRPTLCRLIASRELYAMNDRGGYSISSIEH
jgi:hypothetical protein